jgi:hypothetical protein
MNKKPIITPIYKEALLEVDNLRNVAEEDAKKAILEAMTPIVKKEIDKSMKSAGKSFLFEEDEALTQALNAPLPPGQPDASPPPPATLPVPAAPAGPPAEVPPAPPIPVSSAGVALPMSAFGDGKEVSFNLSDLYTQTGGNVEALDSTIVDFSFSSKL